MPTPYRDEVQLIRGSSAELLESEGVFEWPVRELSVASIPWFYDRGESCYISEGRAIVTPGGDDTMEVSSGDVLHIPQGVACYWEVMEPIRLHYRQV